MALHPNAPANQPPSINPAAFMQGFYHGSRGDVCLCLRFNVIVHLCCSSMPYHARMRAL
jgi:hypothetical protein